MLKKHFSQCVGNQRKIVYDLDFSDSDDASDNKIMKKYADDDNDEIISVEEVKDDNAQHDDKELSKQNWLRNPHFKVYCSECNNLIIG